MGIIDADRPAKKGHLNEASVDRDAMCPGCHGRGVALFGLRCAVCEGTGAITRKLDEALTAFVRRGRPTGW